MELLGKSGVFPLDSFVRVDPDHLRRELPEIQAYMQRDPATAGILTHKEVRGRVIPSLGMKYSCFGVICVDIGTYRSCSPSFGVRWIHSVRWWFCYRYGVL